MHGVNSPNHDLCYRNMACIHYYVKKNHTGPIVEFPDLHLEARESYS